MYFRLNFGKRIASIYYTKNTKDMKLRIIVIALLIAIFTSISNYADAAPWRGGYRGGWGHPVVRAFIPVPRVFIPPVPVPVVVGGGYYGPGYYGRPYYGPG